MSLFEFLKLFVVESGEICLTKFPNREGDLLRSESSDLFFIYNHLYYNIKNIQLK